MFIPPEWGWIVPVLLPFIVGLLVGMIIKKSISLVFLLLILLVILGSVSLVEITLPEIFSRVLEYLPQLFGTGNELFNLLPFGSVTFIIGLLLGLWKG